VRLKVTSITFGLYYTIPDKFKVFENVKLVCISGGLKRNNIEEKTFFKGLNMFPKLNQLQLFATQVLFDNNEKWLTNILAIELQKSSIYGIKSLTSFPNLIYLGMGGGGFEMARLDIESLLCLQKLTIVAPKYPGRIFKMRDINLKETPCLKELYIDFSGTNPSGIPKNLLESNLEKCQFIRHIMSDEEKEIYTNFKKKLKEKKH